MHSKVITVVPSTEYINHASELLIAGVFFQVVELWDRVAEQTGLGRCYIPRGHTYPPEAGKLQIGLSTWPLEGPISSRDDNGLLILNKHRPYLEMLLKILQHGWMTIVAGPRGVGRWT